ncbi:MAG: glycosyltransferase family 4 protein [Actinomycetota bacterium]|nr:glycosyltransferase family 4 protein [Actinomycetota bacterium]
MRILVDATIVKGGLGGIRSYVLGAVGALAQDPEIDLFVATSRPGDFAAIEGLEILGCHPRTQDFIWRSLWREVRLASLARRTSADLVFVPFPELPIRPLHVPSVLVVYDVGPLVAPAFFTRAKRARFALDLGRACRAATKVVCLSNATLIGLHGVTGVDPVKCEVIGAAPPRRLPSPPEGNAEGDDPFILYVGTLLKHKNVSTLVRAFSVKDKLLPWPLILAGPATPEQRRSLDSLTADLGLGDRVRHLGWVDPDQLARLYRDALAVALPSLHEGYGLPALEAMDAGTPVVASDIPAIREVGGDAIVYVDQPLEPESWCNTLANIDADAGERERLTSLARAQAGSHSWEAVGHRLTGLFGAVLQQSA